MPKFLKRYMLAKIGLKVLLALGPVALRVFRRSRKVFAARRSSK